MGSGHVREGLMNLVLTRSQKESGMLSKSVTFVLGARADLTEEEKHNVQKYRLGSEVIYNSEKSREHMERAGESGLVGGLARLAMHRLSLNITVDSLARGQTVECKSLEEVMGAEEAVRTACEQLKAYLDIAATFDGRQEVIEF